ncbi:small nuclear ribonucleoprotein [Candidatus Woesearchaeota archaeon B3_Woes]|nr:MAG: small nuclear ribonucleoprotein [Candidatus Woesearchaeota archaeon B3_Woes]
MEEQMSRPFDALNRAKGKRVVVELKNGKQYRGVLEAFDPHINTVLNETEEHVQEEVEKEIDGKKTRVKTGNMVLKRKLGNVFLRGDTITIISPE